MVLARFDRTDHKVDAAGEMAKCGCKRAAFGRICGDAVKSGTQVKVIDFRRITD